MKHYDICLNNRLTEGDVYLLGSSGTYDIDLLNRLTEGEIIIYNLPFRMSIAGENGIVLDSAVLGTLLRALIRVEPGVVLGASVDGTLETNFETVVAGIPLNADIGFLVHYAIEPEETGVELSASLDTSAVKTAGGESGFAISVNPVEAIVGKSLGSGESAFVLQTALEGYDIYGTVRGDAGIEIGAKVLGEHMDMAETVSTGVEMRAEIANTLCTIPGSGNSGFILDVAPFDAFVHSPLGGGETAIVLDASVLPDGEGMTGLVRVENEIHLGAKAEFTSRIYLDPIELTLGTNASMSIANGYYRILEELDPYTLADLDRASLADLDFEEIDG